MQCRLYNSDESRDGVREIVEEEGGKITMELLRERAQMRLRFINIEPLVRDMESQGELNIENGDFNQPPVISLPS